MPYLEEMMLPYLARIAAPTLVIEGAEGYILDEESRTRRLAALPNLVAEIRVPNAGHHVHLDAPSTVAEHIRALLARAPSPEPRTPLS
jgi:pimeloyl-ACP methyl ester carboxylesterase